MPGMLPGLTGLVDPKPQPAASLQRKVYAGHGTDGYRLACTGGADIVRPVDYFRWPIAGAATGRPCGGALIAGVDGGRIKRLSAGRPI
jgi:hypothetical protein